MSEQEWKEGFPAGWNEADSYDDWPSAFEVASRDTTGISIELSDVESVHRWCEGANDDSNWPMVGVLKDGRWFFMTAGCDYTGWGCQDWGQLRVAKDLEGLQPQVDGEERERLGYV